MPAWLLTGRYRPLRSPPNQYWLPHARDGNRTVHDGAPPRLGIRLRGVGGRCVPCVVGVVAGAVEVVRVACSCLRTSPGWTDRRRRWACRVGGCWVGWAWGRAGRPGRWWLAVVGAVQ